MKRVELGPGIHRLPTITEPTHLVSVAGWDAILEPEADGHVVAADAPVMVEGCQIRHGETGIQGLWMVEAVDCWIHNNRRHGINTRGSVVARHCLVERNGLDNNRHHGIYGGKGTAWIERCIVTNNAAAQVCKLSYTQMWLSRNLLAGRWPVWGVQCHADTFHASRNTIKGATNVHIDGLDDPEWIFVDNNAVIGNGIEETPASACLDIDRRLYMPVAPGSLANWGCYDFQPELTMDRAKEFWHAGRMMAVAGWSTDSAEYPQEMCRPLFPGDPVPE